MQADTDELLNQAAEGDAAATQSLFDRHRQRLRRMVEVYLDKRVRGRVDPSDVVQETLIHALKRLPDYLESRSMSFYPWLRQLAVEQIYKAHRHHLHAQRRSVIREEPLELSLPEHSDVELAEVLATSATSPSRIVQREELRRRTQKALMCLSERDRQVLVLRYLEQLRVREIAEALNLSEGAVKMRHLRALERLGRVLDNPDDAG